jgi:hypothetical protein
MSFIENHLKFLMLLVIAICASSLRAASDKELKQLEAEMLKYIETKEHDKFFEITDKLKEASREAGNERMFYEAWTNQCIYEASQQYFQRAHEKTDEMRDYARQEGSVYGEYRALYAEAMTLMQEKEYDAAEKLFLKAIDFHHRRFSNESAAEDLRELMKIAYLRNDMERAKHYANQLLAEPNLAPHHKGRTLSRLCIMAFDEDNVDEFNRLYAEMKRLSQADGIKLINIYTEVNYHIINGDFKEALLLADRLPTDTCAERKAIIYHRLGDNEKAYEYMRLYKHVSDSITHASHNSVVSSMYLRMNNDRLRLEQEVLANQNSELRYQLYMAVGILLILVLLFIIYQRHRIIKLLKQDNTMLDYSKQGAERALKDLNELSFYESTTELPLTKQVKVNKLCDHLANVTQNHSSKGVVAVFQTDLTDDFEIKTNPEALEKLLSHLLDCSARFAREGVIRLRCEEIGEFIRFSISDTSQIFNDKPKEGFSNLFSNQEEMNRFIGTNFNICQSISRLLYGRFWRDKAYTNGTRFVFEIPAEPPL